MKHEHRSAISSALRWVAIGLSLLTWTACQTQPTEIGQNSLSGSKAGNAWIRAPLPAGWSYGFAKVVSVDRGQIRYRKAGGTWKKGRVGLKLHEGDSVRTENQTDCDLFLGPNGPVVRLTPSTLLTLERLRFQPTSGEPIIQTVLEVEEGRILGNVQKLNPASVYEVRTRQGTTKVGNE